VNIATFYWYIVLKDHSLAYLSVKLDDDVAYSSQVNFDAPDDAAATVPTLPARAGAVKTSVRRLGKNSMFHSAMDRNDKITTAQLAVTTASQANKKRRADYCLELEAMRRIVDNPSAPETFSNDELRWLRGKYREEALKVFKR
jgi:hypothetical protein